MSDNPYDGVKGGRLSFKGGALASRSHGVDKKSKKKKKDKKKHEEIVGEEQIDGEAMLPGDGDGDGDGDGAEVIYTIDAAKKMKYEDIFPVETRKFGYDPKATNTSKSVEAALDDRVKKKADRYCK